MPSLLHLSECSAKQEPEQAYRNHRAICYKREFTLVLSKNVIKMLITQDMVFCLRIFLEAARGMGFWFSFFSFRGEGFGITKLDLPN